MAGAILSLGVTTQFSARSPDVTMDAAVGVRGLPWHHKDPFDRLLIARARALGATIVTHDDAFAAYGVPLLEA